MDELSSIGVAVGGIVAAIGTLVARWSETNAENPWYVRLARVFDLTQVFDSTRKLDD
jgi:hypothetical protein